MFICLTEEEVLVSLAEVRPQRVVTNNRQFGWMRYSVPERHRVKQYRKVRSGESWNKL